MQHSIKPCLSETGIRVDSCSKLIKLMLTDVCLFISSGVFKIPEITFFNGVSILNFSWSQSSVGERMFRRLLLGSGFVLEIPVQTLEIGISLLVNLMRFEALKIVLFFGEIMIALSVTYRVRFRIRAYSLCLIPSRLIVVIKRYIRM